MQVMNDFLGKVALVTGGASGIGRATCLALAERGATVIVADIDAVGGQATCARLPASARFLSLDVGDEANWQAVMAQIQAMGQGLHVLANVAGIGLGGELEALTLPQWEQLMRVNATGPFLGCKHALPLMRASGAPAAIVNVGSVAAIAGAPDLAGYCASKGALRMLSKAVALYCAQRGDAIRCNAVHPTYVDSEMLDPIAALHGGREVMVAAMSRLVPAGRLCTPEDVAAMVVFLASDAAGMITGADMMVDGGQTAGIAPAHFADA